MLLFLIPLYNCRNEFRTLKKSKAVFTSSASSAVIIIIIGAVATVAKAESLVKSNKYVRLVNCSV